MVLSKQRYLLRGCHLLLNRGIIWEKAGVTDPFFLKIEGLKNDEEIVWWLQYSKFCSMK